MGKHRKPRVYRFPTRIVLLGSAVAAGAICIALAGAGTANAKTHHGPGAPGNPFSSPVRTARVSGTSSPGTQNVVRTSTTSIVLHSNGGGGNNGAGPAASGGGAGTNNRGSGASTGGTRTSVTTSFSGTKTTSGGSTTGSGGSATSSGGSTTGSGGTGTSVTGGTESQSKYHKSP
jgi:hypothetical protein